MPACCSFESSKAPCLLYIFPSFQASVPNGRSESSILPLVSASTTKNCLQNSIKFPLSNIVASDSVKRWVLLGYSDEKPCTFATYLRFIGHEQIFWTPTPGWLVPTEVEGSTEMWKDIGSRLRENSDPKRHAELMTIIKEVP